MIAVSLEMSDEPILIPSSLECFISFQMFGSAKDTLGHKNNLEKPQPHQLEVLAKSLLM